MTDKEIRDITLQLWTLAVEGQAEEFMETVKHLMRSKDLKEV